MEHSASTSSLSQSQLQPHGWDYEVFLSFRGTDTRTGFTDFLYSDLIDAGIRAFRDNEELRVGEEIGPELLQAIQSSKISIPIFSSGYASSKWCLMELAHILQCKKSMGQKIIPIFYDVEPWDVRHQGGSYEVAFQEHEKRFDEKTIKQWRETLKEVGELKGLELKNIADGHEGSFVKMVVAKVWRELKKSNSMIVSDSLVGINYHVEEMKKLSDVNSGGVRMIGILGMGGIGKTTIARVIYNHFFERFEYCCFVADVRECSSHYKGLVDLQNYMISNILNHRDLSVHMVDQGRNVIRETFCNKKVLIVLDDVDKREQLDALAQKHAWFGFGSRIIITTRIKEIFDAHPVDGIYEPKELNAHHALQLLCKHAFKSNHPPEGFIELSRNIASTTAGLPLALEVAGSFLCGKSKEVWKDTLKKLKSIPHDRVQEKLRISYDALSHEQKQIFLDIACLFTKADKRFVSYMWDACGFYPENSIEVLIQMSLVKVGEYNELIMHDQLKYLGREIVRQENFFKAEKRSRLWSHEEALEVLQGRQEAENVEVLCLYFEAQSRNFCLTNDEFEKFPNLRFLHIVGADLGGDFKGLLRRLRWLSWIHIPRNFIPENFDLVNLTILRLYSSNLTNDWEGWNQLKVAKKLKLLSVTDCPITSSPDFSGYMNLEELELQRCKSLVNFHPSIWDLKYLKRLYVSRTGITELPKSIGKLKNLEELDASFCENLTGEVPVDIGNLKCLRTVGLADSKINSLPTTMHALLELKTLNLAWTSELQSLPELPRKLAHLQATCSVATSCSNLFELEQLETLHLSGWPELLQTPKEISTFSRLHDMSIRFCAKLQSISGLPTSLVKLEVDDCPKLLEIKGLGNLTSLKVLRVTRCVSVRGLPDFSNFKELQDFEISRGITLTDLVAMLKARKSHLFK